MKKKTIIGLLSVAIIMAIGSTFIGCNLSKVEKNLETIEKKEQNLNSLNNKVNTIGNKTEDTVSSEYFKINSDDSENIKLHKKAYNTCYSLYKQGFILRNYILNVEEMCFEHGKNTVYEIIYNCIYKDMDIEVPLESLKSEKDSLIKELNSLSENSNIAKYASKFKAYYNKGEYDSFEKALLSNMSCNEFMLESYDKKLNSAMENQKKLLDEMKKELKIMRS